MTINPQIDESEITLYNKLMYLHLYIVWQASTFQVVKRTCVLGNTVF